MEWYLKVGKRWGYEGIKLWIKFWTDSQNNCDHYTNVNFHSTTSSAIYSQVLCFVSEEITTKPQFLLYRSIWSLSSIYVRKGVIYSFNFLTLLISCLNPIFTIMCNLDFWFYFSLTTLKYPKQMGRLRYSNYIIRLWLPWL